MPSDWRKRCAADWSLAEDRRPGLPLTRTQPETTARGRVWTQLVTFPWPAPGFTQMTIRDVNGDWLVGHGRVYEVPKDEDDGA